MNTATVDAFEPCDKEPIHTPGSIQPHGVLLAFTPNGNLVASSLDADKVAGPLPAIGMPLSALHLNPSARAAIALEIENESPFPPTLTIDSGDFNLDMILHRSEGLLIVELEKRARDAPAHKEHENLAQEVIDALPETEGLLGTLQSAVNEIRRLTGFDRVLAYQFLRDDSGEVIAESKRDTITTLLGQRFPASDIPAQARMLYIVNPIRLIADTSYQALPLSTDLNPLTGRKIDLSLSVLRSVSPIHLEYMKNMGMRASMSISIVIQGRLWGLLSCHHQTPKLVPYAVRLSCVLLADVMSRTVGRFEDEAKICAAAEITSLHQKITDAASQTTDMRFFFHGSAPQFIQILQSSGCALMMKRQLVKSGGTPTSEQLLRFGDWLADNNKDRFFYTNHLKADVPNIEDWPLTICGVMAICIDHEQKSYIFWFRHEQIEKIDWAGRPENDGTTVHAIHRTPRKSFAIWKQEVKEHSVPWTNEELKIARILGIELSAMARNSRIHW